MNWFKKQSNIKKISQYNLTTTNKHNISSINDNTKKQNPDSFGSIRKTHLNQDNNDDEYVETFPMNINTFSNNLEHLTIQTNTFPNLSNHYMIL
ncbi:hypothetical protein Smp_175300 [Schistosoma mansoni]|nr:hypothetical protein Smp_175300 [Schistosoma mansoni]|eukprot:XP_018646714.1 hypothetical protein Smp_175300 [Schistosoma mansoni]